VRRGAREPYAEVREGLPDKAPDIKSAAFMINDDIFKAQNNII